MVVRRAINSPSNPSHDIPTRYLISFTFYNTQFDELILVLFSYSRGGQEFNEMSSPTPMNTSKSRQGEVPSPKKLLLTKSPSKHPFVSVDNTIFSLCLCKQYPSAAPQDCKDQTEERSLAREPTTHL
jgi:hypothetical protein